MACRKMNEYVAYARNTESGCNERDWIRDTLNPQKTDQKCHYECAELEHPGEKEARLLHNYQILHNL